MGAPVIGVQNQGYPPAGTLAVGFGWRNQFSDKHFVGSEYQENRTTEGSEVINNMNLADISVGYQATKRVSLSLAIPFLMATRSQALRNSNTGQLIERYQTRANGVGDIVFVARRWMLDPDTNIGGNVQMGLGFKLPTGEANVTDTFRVFSATPAPNGTITNAVRTVDQSIQPGDGGFGIVGDVAAFKGFMEGKLVIYGSGAYLAQPQTVSGVQTYRGGAGEQIMSIGDQYLVRGGAAFPIPGTTTMSAAFGIRAEGVKVKDLFGGSEGFRRPGIAVSLEPIFNFGKGDNAFSFGVPFAIYRNRKQSVPDEARGAHGDAAFADYLIMAGYTRSFSLK
jgi:hypothetical protein